ncbi:MAG: hypothetical protein OXH57_04165, partial [Ekhidna sp.]|nr:hypothetical protein [Ekhidna sp.]
MSVGDKYFKITNHSLVNLLCVWLEKNSFVGWPKRKIIRHSGSGHGTGLVEVLAERLLNITTNYMTTRLEALHQKNHQSE